MYVIMMTAADLPAFLFSEVLPGARYYDDSCRLPAILFTRLVRGCLTQVILTTFPDLPAILFGEALPDEVPLSGGGGEGGGCSRAG